MMGLEGSEWLKSKSKMKVRRPTATAATFGDLISKDAFAQLRLIEEEDKDECVPCGDNADGDRGQDMPRQFLTKGIADGGCSERLGCLADQTTPEMSNAGNIKPNTTHKHARTHHTIRKTKRKNTARARLSIFKY